MRPLSSRQTNAPKEFSPASCFNPRVLVVNHQKPGRTPTLGSSSGPANPPGFARQGLLESGVLLTGIEPERDER